MNREAWHATVHGVAKSWTWLSNWTELTHCFHKLLLGFPFYEKKTLKHCYSIINSLQSNLLSCLSLYPAPSEPLCIWVSRIWKAFPFFLAIYNSSIPQNQVKNPQNRGIPGLTSPQHTLMILCFPLKLYVLYTYTMIIGTSDFNLYLLDYCFHIL